MTFNPAWVVGNGKWESGLMTFNPAWVVGNGKWESGLDISPPAGAKRKTLTPPYGGKTQDADPTGLFALALTTQPWLYVMGNVERMG